MDYTLKDLEDMCIRLEHLCKELCYPPSGTISLNEYVVSEAVQVIQRVGECLAWANGQHGRDNLGEAFTMPFLERHVRDRLRDLLGTSNVHLQAQVLQTIHILLAVTSEESTLFCHLTAGWYLNQIVTAHFDFKNHDDLLPLWMTVVKDIATKINGENIMLFFDPSSDKPFPMFSEAIQYYHHPVSQVRTHVQATSLEIFLKLKNEDDYLSEGTLSTLFQLVVKESEKFFTHVCCLLRDFWRMADEAVIAGNKRDAHSAFCIQNDMLMYLNDVFMCDIPELSNILQEKLLRFALLPVLLGSALCLQRHPLPAQETAWYLLCDFMATLRSPHILTALATAMLRPHGAEEMMELVELPPPRTPLDYFVKQASWGGTAQPGPFDKFDVSSDEALYGAAPVPIMSLLDARSGASRPLVRNKLLDHFEERLRCWISAAGQPAAGQAASCTMAALELLLQALRASKEGLDASVAERLGGIVCDCLARHSRLPWAVSLCALRALRELIAAADVTSGHARMVLGPLLRDKVLAPLAEELLREASAQAQQGSSAQESWLHEFQEQWFAFASDLSELPDSTQQVPISMRHQLPEPGQEPDMPDAPPIGRTRCLRVLLAVHRLAAGLAGVASKSTMEMPGLSEAEREESLKYQPGVPVHIGKMNRVKCYAHGPAPGLEKEAVYLLPAQHTLLLVRPDDQKPFWAVPVIAEPLRLVRLIPGDENAGRMDLQQLNASQSSHDRQKTLQLEVSSPRSPALRQPYGSGLSALPLRPASGSGYPGTQPGRDQLAHTMPVPGLPLSGDFLSGPSLPNMPGPRLSSEATSEAPLPLALAFSDDRRRRVAWKVIAQAQNQVNQRISEGVMRFLTDIQRGNLPT